MAAQPSVVASARFPSAKLTVINSKGSSQLQNDKQCYIATNATSERDNSKASTNSRELNMQDTSFNQNLLEMNDDEINAISGGVVFVAPVVIKIGVWALGAAASSALVLGVIHNISK